SRKPSIPFHKLAEAEGRWSSLMRSNPAHAEELLAEAQKDVEKRFHLYEQMAKMDWSGEN
ncbi:MAG: hypothetical protein B1H09_02990, partial [Gemmatimonadaceae bacterium 4484_173]